MTRRLSLYTKLAGGLALLLVCVGLLYALISVSATQRYIQEVSQRLNRDLARNLVMDRNLVAEGRLDQQALKRTFEQYMSINPGIEIYLLDADGQILSYSADPGHVKRRSVDLEPIRRFLAGEPDFPLLGDDPRSHQGRKAFSVTPVPSADNLEGYLYVVLRGEQYDAVDALLRESHVLRLGGWAMAISLGVGLVAGLLVLRLVTRRVQHLAGRMDAFAAATPRTGAPPGAAGDEVDRLEAAFDDMARRIRAQIGELEEQDALRRRLVAQVSHDLRTPLASLRGYLESLQMRRESLSEAERGEYLAVALRHAERLSHLVGDLFELAALDARERQPHCEPFPMAELAADVVEKFRLRARQQGVALEVEPPRVLPLVAADVGLAERVLDNLLDNALTHTPPGGTVSLSLEEADGRVWTRVRDSGPGIPPDQLEQVFEPFFRGGDRAHGAEHAGLGLAIARRIVELHGGELRVASPPGQGAEFRFSLPVADRTG